MTRFHLRHRHVPLLACLMLLFLVVKPCAGQAPAGSPAAMLQLVLAIDTSRSVNNVEYSLQMHGYASAFRSAPVLDAIEQGGPIAVAVVHWSGIGQYHRSIDWTLISDAQSSLALAARLDQIRRPFDGAGTAISFALRVAAREFARSPYAAPRQVIDVSGDGIDNRGPLPSQVRDPLVAAGMVINGIAILNENPQLDSYYHRYVIGGEGAFVMTAQNFLSFADAITAKLVREILGAPVS